MRSAGYWLGMGAAVGMVLVSAGGLPGSAWAVEPCASGLLWGPGQAEADPNSGPVSAVRWDPDGPGPEREWLVFGGGPFSSGLNLTFYGTVYAWDGGRFHGIGQNDPGAPSVANAMVNWNGTLVAGGVLSVTSHVVSWDGVHWTPVATNIKAGTVTGLLVYRGELVVTGFSNSVEGLRLTDDRISAVMVLRNGQWEPLGPEQPGVGRDLIEFEGDLVVGGRAAGRPMVSRWNGSEWTSMTPANWVGTEVRRFAVFDGRLTAVGRVNVPPSTKFATALVWNGSNWDRLGSDVGPEGYSIAVHDDALWVTLSSGFGASSGLYRWDRRTWEKYLPEDVTSMGFGFASYPLLSWHGDLVVCGASVTSPVAAPSTTAVRSVLRITNGRLQSLAAGALGASSSQFYASAGSSYAGRLFVGGQLISGGFERSSGIVAWDGVNWGDHYRVTALQTAYGFAVHPTGLLAFGNITLVPGPSNTSLPAWGILRWDGTQWTAFGDASNVTSAATIQDVLVDGGEIFAARIESFSPTISSVRRWTGSGWEQLGGTTTGSVTRLIRFNGVLLACGTFTQWDGNTVGRVAQWDGTQWVALGVGMNNSVLDLAVHQGDLYACGRFSTADNQAVFGVARWSGQSWGPVGSGPSTGNMTCLRSYRGELFAGGLRVETGPTGWTQYAALERWNGATWSAIDLSPTDPNSIVNALAEHNGELVILGGFRQSSTQGFDTVRRWSSEKSPWVAWQPESANTVCGGSATFRARVANGYDISSAAWYRGSEPVVPDRAAGVRVEFSGGHSTLRLDNVDASDAGQYRCVFTHPCGSVESAAAALTVSGTCCPGDLTLDAIVDDADFQGFAAAYDVLDCSSATMRPGCPADLNNDGLVDDADFGVFIGAYDALVCE